MAGNRHGDRWEHFAHGADIGVRGVGVSKSHAFEQIALALTAVITDPSLVRPETAVTIECSAPTEDLLVADWLNAIVFEMATRRMLFSVFHVELQGTALHATARGEAIDRARHEPAVEVKGATYTALRFDRRPDGTWIAECVVDV